MAIAGLPYQHLLFIYETKFQQNTFTGFNVTPLLQSSTTEWEKCGWGYCPGCATLSHNYSEALLRTSLGSQMLLLQEAALSYS